ncbi:SulP family inorganic anion transporter, partial [Enterococcus faecium]
GWGLLGWVTFKVLFTNKYWSAVLLFILTMICTVIFDISIAIVIGVIGGCVFFFVKNAAITISLETIDWQRMGLPEKEKLNKLTVV